MGPDEQTADVRCQWCGEKAPAAASHCRACGAALAQRESIGDLVIPGVTDVDPDLKLYDRLPRRLQLSSPTQAMAGGTMGAAASADPMGLLALGALGVVAAQELAGASEGRGGKPVDIERLGVPSAAVAQMIEKLEQEARAPAAPEEGAPAPGVDLSTRAGDPER